MMDASTSSTDWQSRLQLHGAQSMVEEAQLPDASGELSAPPPDSKALWTDGSPDKAKIAERMEQTLHAYLQLPPIVVSEGHFRHQRWLAEVHRRQNMFYAEMHYYEDLLYATPVLSLQAESNTTIVPYEQAKKRRRGRPATGIKPRDRRKRPDDEAY